MRAGQGLWTPPRPSVSRTLSNKAVVAPGKRDGGEAVGERGRSGHHLLSTCPLGFLSHASRARHALTCTTCGPAPHAAHAHSNAFMLSRRSGPHADLAVRVHRRSRNDKHAPPRHIRKFHCLGPANHDLDRADGMAPIHGCAVGGSARFSSSIIYSFPHSLHSATRS